MARKKTPEKPLQQSFERSEIFVHAAGEVFAWIG